MKLALGIGIFVLAGMSCGANAQTYQSETGPRIAAPTPPKPAPIPNTAEDEESYLLIKEARKTTGELSKYVKCASMAPKVETLARYAEFLKQSENSLKVLSNVLTSISLGWNIATGNVDRTIDDIQNLAVSKGGCALAGPLCPVYTAGMTFGSVINQLPKLLYWDANEQTINEVVTDYYAPIFGDLVYGKPTVAQLEERIAKMRADAVKARAGAQAAYDKALMCRKTDEAKSFVDELLAKAKAKAKSAAVPMTPADSGLSAATDAAISDGRAAANSANAAGNSQTMTSMQTWQEQAMQQPSNPEAAGYPAPGGELPSGSNCIGTQAQCDAIIRNCPPGSGGHC